MKMGGNVFSSLCPTTPFWPHLLLLFPLLSPQPGGLIASPWTCQTHPCLRAFALVLFPSENILSPEFLQFPLPCLLRVFAQMPFSQKDLPKYHPIQHYKLFCLIPPSTLFLFITFTTLWHMCYLFICILSAPRQEHKLREGRDFCWM